MSYVGAPLERLEFFQSKLGLSSEDLASLEPYRSLFLSRRDDFSEYLHAFLSDIPEAWRVVELMEARGGLRRNWKCWYEGLFTQSFNPQFYNFLWSSGLKHVSRNVDQRFIHLGYCVARLFFGEIIDKEVPVGDRHRVRAVVDKMLDQCLLVATDAFLAGTTQCDREVINGIAHQVRNPLMVIGGFIRNLQKRMEGDSPVQSVLATMFGETRRLETMVRDVGTYIEIMQQEPEFVPCSLEAILSAVVRRLTEEGWNVEVELYLREVRDVSIESAPRLLETLFYHGLQNALEATRQEEAPVVRVTARLEGSPSNALVVEIFNNGAVPGPEDLEHLFTPFFSSKPTGSGFGLPIAALVARKVNGEIDLKVSPGEGTRTIVSIPFRGAEALNDRRDSGFTTSGRAHPGTPPQTFRRI